MQRAFSIVVLALTACGGAPDAELPTAEVVPAQAGASEYAYVLGTDGASSIVGGAHFVQRLDERREAYGTANLPQAVHPELIDAALIYDPELVRGETDWDVFPSSWWPMALDGIAARWWSPDEASPAEKYDELFFPDELEVVQEVSHWYYDETLDPVGDRPPQHSHPEVTVGPTTAWELTRHGVYQSVHPDSWWGHCNGWASYAVAEPSSFPLRSIDVRLVDEQVVECVEDTTDCVRFRKGDLEALAAEVWFNDAATFGGQRCDVRPEDIERDELGRPVDAECRDLNPGTFHVVVTQLLGVGGEHLATGLQGRPPVVIDHSADWEVWNFPLVGFEVLDALELDEPDAAELIGRTDGEWPYNQAAVRFVRVRMVYTIVSDDVSTGQLMRTADQRNVEPVDVELAYILELDADDRILGGEWLDDPAWRFGPDSLEVHPDFVWIPTDHRGELEWPDDKGGNNDNPRISYSSVQRLLDCANDPTTCAPVSTDPGTPVDPQPEPDEEEAGAACGCSAGGPSVGWLAVLSVLMGRRRRV